jgi:hypothetical protein
VRKKKNESQGIINSGFAQNSFTKFGFISFFVLIRKSKKEKEKEI